MTSVTWGALAFAGLIVIVLLLMVKEKWDHDKSERNLAIMTYLIYEDLRLRADGSTDEDVLGAYDFKPIEEFPPVKDGRLMWLKNKDGNVSLAYSDGHIIWAANTNLGQLDGWALINEGDDKIRIDVEFVEESGEDEDNGGDGPAVTV